MAGRSSLMSLKPALDRLYDSFNYPHSATDPIHIVRRWKNPADLEIVGFVAAALAFGRVASVMQSVERVVAVVGPEPANYVRRFDPRREAPRFAGIVHRWIREPDLVALFWLMRQMLEQSGSIEGFFVEGREPAAPFDIARAIDSFSRRAMALDLASAYGKVPRRPGVGYFFPRPEAGSACKRLNLFLRWMVRKDALDLGVWTRVPPASLVVPLDTHVIRVGRCLRLTRRLSPGWQMAREITTSLGHLDADDPVKYDFAICHLGMMDACGFGQQARSDAMPLDSQCPLRGACRPKRAPRKSKSKPA